MDYDVVIIGGGPGGLTAGLYAARGDMKTLLLEKLLPGGQAATTYWIDNYPGFPEGVSGPQLMMAMKDQAERFGLEIKTDDVSGLEPVEDGFSIRGGAGVYTAHAVIIASGATVAKLGVPGEEKLRGKGVSYCAICDAALFRGKVVAVVGGGNTAFMDAELLTEYASKVYIIHRRRGFRAEPIYVERLKENPKVEFVIPYVVKRIEGEDKVQKLIIENRETGEEKELPVDGVFIDIGMEPQTELLKPLGVELTERGYVVVREDQSTNVPGLYAAGDVTTACNGVHQIITAAAQGTVAALSAYDYIKALEGKK